MVENVLYSERMPLASFSSVPPLVSCQPRKSESLSQGHTVCVWVADSDYQISKGIFINPRLTRQGLMRGIITRCSWCIILVRALQVAVTMPAAPRLKANPDAAGEFAGSRAANGPQSTPVTSVGRRRCQRPTATAASTPSAAGGPPPRSAPRCWRRRLSIGRQNNFAGEPGSHGSRPPNGCALHPVGQSIQRAPYPCCLSAA